MLEIKIRSVLYSDTRGLSSPIFVPQFRYLILGGTYVMKYKKCIILRDLCPLSGGILTSRRRRNEIAFYSFKAIIVHGI